MTLIRLTFDELEPSPDFAGWLAEERLTIALTRGNNLSLIGTRADGSLGSRVSLVVSERSFGLCRGIAASGSETIVLATRYQIWRLENALAPGTLTDDGFERLFLPQTAWTTGMLHVRDLAISPDGEITFVNGLFSCLCRPSDRLNFEPLWVPPFISDLAHEDRCHLSGVALAPDGAPAFVTSASRSDTADGWRTEQRTGGVVVSARDGSVVAAGLSMPSSPVLRDGRLWLCVGGAGELAVIDGRAGEPGAIDGSTLACVAQLPGFTRGLALHGDDHAVLATSQPRRGEDFDELPLGDRLRRTGVDPAGQCGVFVVDTRSGDVEHSLLFAGRGGEIQDLALLTGARSATAVAFAGDDVQELVSIPSQMR